MKSNSLVRWPILVICLVSFATPLLGQQSIQFDRDIRPILSDKCYACHGPDKAARESGLRLDIQKDAVSYGVFDKEDWRESIFFERISSDDPDDMMPPPAAHKPLTKPEAELLTRWLQEGAEYQAHWAYQPIQPAPAADEIATTTHPIDRFIDAGLKNQNLEAVSLANPNLIVRRLAFDLTGLPPSALNLPELERYLDQPSDENYQAMAVALIDSKYFGQRMATPWLDVVRYSDTVGYHGDQNQNVWAYRDWVIDSINRDQPMDEFTVHQIAGDLLPEPTTDQLVASCFNRLNMMTREGGAQPGEYLAKYSADRVRTIGMAWMGTTLGCAECHDHKFDPVTAEDFYSMAAFFSDIQQWGVYSSYPYTPEPELSGFSNDFPFPPEISVESEFLVRRLSELMEQADQVTQADVAKFDESQFTEWKNQSNEFLEQNPEGWISVSPILKEKTKDAVVQEDGSVLLNGVFESRFQLDFQGHLASIRIEINPSADHKDSLRRDGKVGSIDLGPKLQLKRKDAEKFSDIGIHIADANLKTSRYSNGAELIGIRNGWRTASHTEKHFAVLTLRSPVEIKEGDVLLVDLRDNKRVGQVRFAVSPLAITNANQTLQLPIELEKQAEVAYIRSSGQRKHALEQLQQLDRKIQACRNGRTPVLITKAVDEPRVTRVLPRGNWQDLTGKEVAPNTPNFLPPLQVEGDRRPSRLDLAKWLIDDQNPLTARVIVNRMWRQFFGKALSPNADDLGAQGQAPSHPQLLDDMAKRFQQKWSRKELVLEIVTSQAYRRSSQTTESLQKADPENRWLARQRPRRLPAEMVRDNALAISGLLSTEHGGPPIKPYQPGRYYRSLQFPDRRYQASKGSDQYRRGVYVHWQRTFLHPMLANFDAPSREDCTAMRNEANNPQQALTLLNDPTFVEAAKVLATRLLRTNESTTERSDTKRLEHLFELALNREPTADESKSLIELLNQLLVHYAENSDDARKLMTTGSQSTDESIPAEQLAAWINVCRVVLNLHETITRY